jgi:transposase
MSLSKDTIYHTHTSQRGEDNSLIKNNDGFHVSRRWVVERTNSWHNNRFRKLLVRYEKKAENYTQ